MQSGDPIISGKRHQTEIITGSYDLQVKQHTGSTMTPWNLLQLLRRSCRPQNDSWGQDETQILKTDQIRIFSDHVLSVGFCPHTEHPSGKQLEFRAATNLVCQMFNQRKKRLSALKRLQMSHRIFSWHWSITKQIISPTSSRVHESTN